MLSMLHFCRNVSGPVLSHINKNYLQDNSIYIYAQVKALLAAQPAMAKVVVQ